VQGVVEFLRHRVEILAAADHLPPHVQSEFPHQGDHPVQYLGHASPHRRGIHVDDGFSGERFPQERQFFQGLRPDDRSVVFKPRHGKAPHPPGGESSSSVPPAFGCRDPGPPLSRPTRAASVPSRTREKNRFGPGAASIAPRTRADRGWRWPPASIRHGIRREWRPGVPWGPRTAPRS